MKYFGIPTCPYCKKRVNLIRAWSLKKQGEYVCPRCAGISNVYHSPLIYVAALLAIFSGGTVYFFHRYVLDDLELKTVVSVLVPFAVFFLLSLFMVYLAKPVIKTVTRGENGRRKTLAAPENLTTEPSPARSHLSGQSRQLYDETDEFLPKVEYRTGPLPQELNSLPLDRTIEMPAAKPAATRQAYVRRASPAEDPAPRSTEPAAQERQASRAQLNQPFTVHIGDTPSVVSTPARGQTPARQTVSAPAAEIKPTGTPAQVRPVQARQPAEETAPAPRQRRAQPRQSETEDQPAAPRRTRTPRAAKPAQAETATAASAWEVVKPKGTIYEKGASDDFLSRYDDPEYVERRLRELENGTDK